LFLECFCDVSANLGGHRIVGVFRAYDHAQFSARLDRKGLFDALEALGDRFEFFHAFDVAFERFASSTRSRSAAGICGGNEESVRKFRGELIVVSECGVDDMLVLPGSFEQIGSNLWVAAFEFVVGGFADIVE
jgi:hypothetical protein